MMLKHRLVISPWLKRDSNTLMMSTTSMSARVLKTAKARIIEKQHRVKDVRNKLDQQLDSIVQLNEGIGHLAEQIKEAFSKVTTTLEQKRADILNSLDGIYRGMGNLLLESKKQHVALINDSGNCLQRSSDLMARDDPSFLHQYSDISQQLETVFVKALILINSHSELSHLLTEITNSSYQLLSSINRLEHILEPIEENQLYMIQEEERASVMPLKELDSSSAQAPTTEDRSTVPPHVSDSGGSVIPFETVEFNAAGVILLVCFDQQPPILSPSRLSNDQSAGNSSTSSDECQKYCELL